MPIDQCDYTFNQLSEIQLPRHFSALEEAIKSPISASEFVGFKSASRAALSKVGREADFSGCYVFIQEGKPFYVGISRSVVKRLVQHLNYNSHYSASLVYRLAKHDCPHEMKRDQAMKESKFLSAFQCAQNRLRQAHIAYVEVNNDLELYLLEVFAAMRLDTCMWNTFRTH